MSDDRVHGAQGQGVRVIARTLDVNRETVRRAFRDQGRPRYQRVPRQNPALERLRPVIMQWLFGHKLIGSMIVERLTDPLRWLT